MAMFPQWPEWLRSKLEMALPGLWNWWESAKAFFALLEYIHTGSGSPEGVVTASPGHVYFDITGGAGTTLYGKESGTGNTGGISK